MTREEELILKWGDLSKNTTDPDKRRLPRLEWTDYLTECWNLSGMEHPDYIKYVREMNSRGYAVLMESQEKWAID